MLLKPMHSFLVSLAMLGGGSTDYAAGAVSAGSGVLTVLAVFLLGRRLYSTGTGLLAAAFLAVLPLHVAYSRLALSEANSTLAFSLAVLAYWSGRQPGPRASGALALCGLLLGAAVTLNRRLYVMALVFPLVEVARWVEEDRPARVQRLRRLLLLAYPAALAVAPWSLVFWWLRDYHQGLPATGGFQFWTYEDQFRRFWSLVNYYQRPLYGGLDPGYYPFVLWTSVGPGLLLGIALFAGLSFRDRRWRPQDLLLGAWLAVPALFYLLLTDKAPRCVAVVLPAVALAAARGLLLAASRLPSRRSPDSVGGKAALLAIAAAAILLGSIASWQVALLRGGHGAATAFLAGLGVDRAIAAQVGPVDFYSRGTMNVWELPEEPAKLRELYDHGYRYVVIDDQAYLAPGRRALASAIERRTRPVAVFADTLKEGPQFLLEHSEWMKTDLVRTLELHREIRESRGPSEVRVYDLRGYYQEAGP